ncbi:unnamed protein product [Pleuronectes platessa]|uniref:Uncharacterized protein n=1 Tax=Pleuronectes platessa TaxID=8262 RepID=A0A9N7YGV3_PLEPL|nr:unnamed protein product [Pleuronectes platessa]
MRNRSHLVQFSVKLNIRCERFLRLEEEFWVWTKLNLVLLVCNVGPGGGEFSAQSSWMILDLLNARQLEGRSCGTREEDNSSSLPLTAQPGWIRQGATSRPNPPAARCGTFTVQPPLQGFMMCIEKGPVHKCDWFCPQLQSRDLLESGAAEELEELDRAR